MASWTFGDYVAASDADCLLVDLAPDQKRREAHRRFHVAGGSMRLFLLGVDTAAEMLRRRIPAVSNGEDLFRHSRSVLTALAHRCQDQEAAFHFIALARQALPGHPSWQESVTTVEATCVGQTRLDTHSR
eukprot:gene14520-10378_t